jgi:hypothetical protein
MSQLSDLILGHNVGELSLCPPSVLNEQFRPGIRVRETSQDLLPYSPSAIIQRRRCSQTRLIPKWNSSHLFSFFWHGLEPPLMQR